VARIGRSAASQTIVPRSCSSVRTRASAPAPSAGAMTGAQFEIRIDGTPRSYRDRKDYAMEVGRLIKSKNPHSMVEINDLQSGDITAVALRPRVSDAPQTSGRPVLLSDQRGYSMSEITAASGSPYVITAGLKSARSRPRWSVHSGFVAPSFVTWPVPGRLQELTLLKFSRPLEDEP
jgi:hypothetical protein